MFVVQCHYKTPACCLRTLSRADVNEFAMKSIAVEKFPILCTDGIVVSSRWHCLLVLVEAHLAPQLVQLGDVAVLDVVVNLRQNKK